MYHYVTDREFLSRVRSQCSGLVNQLVLAINGEGRMRVSAHMVGSGAKNMVTQNANEPIDLDYNLNILDFGDFRTAGEREIKEYIRKQFNEILTGKGWPDCEDSTAALTTKKRQLKTGCKTPFSIDLAIVHHDCNGWHRLIHEKTGYTYADRYYWNLASDSADLQKRVEMLKKNYHWPEVREQYLQKKNMYLTRRDTSHPSMNVYIEAVNQVYGRYFRFR